CYCKEPAVIRTGWTGENPGRRFHACLFWKEKNGCNFFKWEDPLMCRRSREIIPGLLRKINRLQSEVTNMEGEVSKLKEDVAKMESGLVEMGNEVSILEAEVVKKDCAKRRLMKLLIVMLLIAFIFFRMWRAAGGKSTGLKMLA
ncbi:hypothetical protein PHJA_002123000, partial [Phtheirospermum japonicum]